MIYIYGLVDPRTQRIKYIGQTIDKESRLRQHISDKTLTPKTIWISELKANGIQPIMVELGQCNTEKSAHDVELNWIYFGRQSGWELTNTIGMKTEKYKTSYSDFIGQKVWGKPFLFMARYAVGIFKFLVLGKEPSDMILGHAKIFATVGTMLFITYVAIAILLK